MNTLLKTLNLPKKVGTFVNFNKVSFHNTAKLNSTKYYPINDDVFGLNEDQKEVDLYISIRFY